MITNKSVQEITEMAKVEEVIQDFVSLKRRGANMMGLCPFHNEKTPSFVVSPAKNIYKCFGCGRAGGPVQFLMEHESFTFPEALRYIAKKYGIEVEETQASHEEIAARQHLDSLYLVNQFAQEYFQQQLFDTDLGKSVGLSYFKRRGFREETIRKFGLGFTTDQRSGFTDVATRTGYTLDSLKKLGLTTQYDRDFFRNRVMFTIYNLSGKPIAFAGRIMAKDVKAPKYINSPETEIYHKSKVLYGANFAKVAIRQQDECILVEGYTDVISLHQAGIQNVVAASGTSLTTQQIRLIKRYTPNVKILFDGDFAGLKAALRGIDLILAQDLNVKVVVLPDGEDPDSYLQSLGTSAFKTYLKERAEDFIFFKTNLLLKQAGNDPVRKTELVKDVVGSISKIPDPIKRSLYIKECARLVSVEEQLLINEINKVVSKELTKHRASHDRGNLQKVQRHEAQALSDSLEQPIPQQKESRIGDEFQEKDIVRILVAGGNAMFDKEENITVAQFIISNIEDVLDDFDNQTYQQIAKLAQERLASGEPLNTDFFTQHPEAAVQQMAINLITSPYELSENWEKRYEITLQTQKSPDLNFSEDSIQALKRFRLRKITRMCQKNQEEIKQLTTSGDMEKLMLHMKVQQKLLNIRNDLAKELGTVVLS
ncbi:MAG: DNA primase [Saprospiraceae bacterium]|nr:DNA primase [Saprospiraceae bacterium]